MHIFAVAVGLCSLCKFFFGNPENIKVFVNANDLQIDSNDLSNMEIINSIKTIKVVKILEKNTVLGKI